MTQAVCDKWALERMNIPERLWSVTYSAMPDSLKEPVKRYVREIEPMLRRGVGFLLLGESGVGKTAAGVVMLKAGWERYKTGYFVTVKDLRQSIRDEVSFDGSESVLGRCRNVDLLVLDDLALDDFRNFTFGIGDVEHLLTSRASRSKTTILTTRVTPSQFRENQPSFLSALQGSFASVQVQGRNIKAESDIELRKKLGMG